MDLSGNLKKPIHYNPNFRYELQFAIEEYIRDMKGANDECDYEIEAGAIDLLGLLHLYLHEHYFENCEVIHVRDIISALDDAHSNSYQSLGSSLYELENMSPIDTENEQENTAPQ